MKAVRHDPHVSLTRIQLLWEGQRTQGAALPPHGPHFRPPAPRREQMACVGEAVCSPAVLMAWQQLKKEVEWPANLRPVLFPEPQQLTWALAASPTRHKGFFVWLLSKEQYITCLDDPATPPPRPTPVHPFIMTPPGPLICSSEN